MPRIYIHLIEQHFNEIVRVFPFENETENLCFQKKNTKLLLPRLLKKMLFRNDVDIFTYLVHYSQLSKSVAGTRKNDDGFIEVAHFHSMQMH